jgi:hypothetical protein
LAGIQFPAGELEFLLFTATVSIAWGPIHPHFKSMIKSGSLLHSLPYIHTYILIYIPWIQIRMTIGCGVSYKNTKLTGKYNSKCYKDFT